LGCLAREVHICRCRNACRRGDAAGRSRYRDASASGAACSGVGAPDTGNHRFHDRGGACRRPVASAGVSAAAIETGGAGGMIKSDIVDGIAILTLAHGKANALDIEFCDALAARFKELRKSGEKAVVLTGQGKIFSAGVDLKRLSSGGADYIREFL